MADNKDPKIGDFLAHKTFVITMAGAVLFIGTVFAFIL